MSAEVPLREAMTSLEWVFPSIGVEVFWSTEQAEKTLVFGKVAMLNHNIEVEGLGSVITHGLQKTLDRMKRNGTIPDRYKDASIPDIGYSFRPQPGMDKNDDIPKKYSCNKNKHFRTHGCLFLELRVDQCYVGMMSRIIRY